MHKKIIVFILMLSLLLTPFFITEITNAADNEEYIVKVKDDLNKSEKKVINKMDEIEHADNLYVSDKETIDKLDDSSIKYIEKNSKFKLLETPNDSYYSNQYYLENADIPYTWNNNIDANNVIAVIDSGICNSHEDIDYTRILTGYNVFDKSTNVTDTVGHGTNITGLISAKKNNNNGIAGISQKVKILPIKVFLSDETELSYIISGIEHVIGLKKEYNDSNGKEGQNISVINLSLGSKDSSQALKETCDNAIEQGIIIVCSAGNDGKTTAQYPAQYTMGVGSINETNEVSSFSQRLRKYYLSSSTDWKKKVWVTAPGESIYTTSKTGGYASVSGTSFSAPIVAILAAMCKNIDRNMTQSEFMQLLKETAIPMTSGEGRIDDQDKAYGYGKISFEKTISKLKENTPPDHTCTADTAVKEYEIPATCTSEGSYDLVTYCKTCGIEMSRTKYSIPKTGHTYGTWTNLNSTSHQRICANDSSHKEIEAHSWNNGVTTLAATCTQTGTKKYTCAKCSATKTASISKLGHKYGKWTKLNNTYHQRICANNSSHKETQAHIWKNPVITKPATFDQSGIKKYTCEACSATKSVIIPKLTKKSLSGAKINLNKTNVVYSGRQIVFKVSSVYLNGALVPSKNYIYTPIAKTNAGMYQITIQGINDYTGTASVKAVITPANIQFKNISKKYKYSKKKRKYSVIKKGYIKSAKKISGSKYIKISKGKVIVKKKTPKGTYKFKVYFKSNGNFKNTLKIFKLNIK